MKAKLICPEAAHINLRLNDLNKRQARQEAATGELKSPQAPLAGDLRYISLFDIIQAVEKNQITGIIRVNSPELNGNVYFNQGLVVDAVVDELRGKTAFKQFAEVSEGYFELEKSPVEFNPAINTTSNSQLILDIFADEDPEQM